MEINTRFLEVTKTARYSTLGVPTPKTKYLWFCLHGSNMLCEQMLYKFSDFNLSEHYVVSPEGLHRFYANGFGGEVLSSWMTKRDRLHEIKDISGYLSKLYKQSCAEVSSECKKIILGFSQGGTMAFRWMHSQEVPFDHLIPYSCWIPEDIDLKKGQTNLAKNNLIYTYGLKDQYLKDDKLTELQEILTKNSLDNVITETYDGNHRVDRNQLRFLFEKYIEV